MESLLRFLFALKKSIGQSRHSFPSELEFTMLIQSRSWTPWVTCFCATWVVIDADHVHHWGSLQAKHCVGRLRPSRRRCMEADSDWSGTHIQKSLNWNYTHDSFDFVCSETCFQNGVVGPLDLSAFEVMYSYRLWARVVDALLWR